LLLLLRLLLRVTPLQVVVLLLLLRFPQRLGHGAQARCACRP
jgi:hypothetical protein